MRAATEPPTRRLNVTSWATPASAVCRWPSSTSGASAGVVSTHVCPSARASSYPKPSLPVLGSERPPVASATRCASTRAPSAVSTTKPVALADDRAHTPAGLDGHAHATRFGKQRIEHRSRSIGVRKQLAVLLFVQWDAERLEKRRCAIGGKRPQDMSDTARRATPEVALGHNSIRDVASRSATHQDLRADLRRAIETAHIQIRRGPLREDRCRETRCTCAYHDRCHLDGGWWMVVSGCSQITVHSSQFTVHIGSWDLGVESREYPRC